MEGRGRGDSGPLSSKVFACHAPREHVRPLLSQEGTTQKGFKDFNLKVKAVIWP